MIKIILIYLKKFKEMTEIQSLSEQVKSNITTKKYTLFMCFESLLDSNQEITDLDHKHIHTHW